MHLTDAVGLIQGAAIGQTAPAVWADLGCGSGLFTQALAHLLPAGSTLYAVDQHPQTIASPSLVSIHFLKANFEKDALDRLPPSLTGILMANSLHYVADKPSLLTRWQQKLTPGAPFIIIEYDSRRSNPWVPYPLPFADLKEVFVSVGYQKIVKLGERPSRYRQGNLYAALCTVDT